MTKWLSLTEEQRINTLNIVSESRNGLPLAAIEKDWWVTLVLKAVFSSAYTSHLVFKGGTSLSKAWDLIERFSEDIDLAIDREVLGFDNEAYSKTRVKKLKRAACSFISTELLAAIKNSLSAQGVPLEGEPFAVMATTPAKTFLEKIFLLHEEFQKDTEKIRTYRMTRHLHDLEKVMDTGHGVDALANEKLYNDIVEHRKVFNLLNFVDHASYGRDQLAFIPPKEVIAAWENDYKQMQVSMFLGETISFAQLINRMEELITRLSGK